MTANNLGIADHIDRRLEKFADVDIELVCRRHRLVRTARVREAAFEVMEVSYMKASDNGSLPTKPRQIMYVARPSILAMTGESELSGSYFSQSLLIDYMGEYDCDDWDIVWDARGHFIEPHTNTEIPLGTLEVRQYLGERPLFGWSANVELDLSFPTNGAEHRFSNILFIEKEGFHQILKAAQLQERWDVALMSTKGMSVTASRKLLDELSLYVDRSFILHDFDRSGFSICGTLGTDSRRYFFNNDVTGKFVDIGLRLAEVEGLQSEPVPPLDPREWRQRAATLQRHGATPNARRNRVSAHSSRRDQCTDLARAGQLRGEIQRARRRKGHSRQRCAAAASTSRHRAISDQGRSHQD